jgi:hypothetical protein
MSLISIPREFTFLRYSEPDSSIIFSLSTKFNVFSPPNPHACQAEAVMTRTPITLYRAQ